MAAGRAREAAQVVLAGRERGAISGNRLGAEAHAHPVRVGLERARRFATNDLGARCLRGGEQRFIEAEARQAGGSERQRRVGVALAGCEPQRLDRHRAEQRQVKAEVGEKLLRLAAQEIAAHFQRRAGRALDDGDARAGPRHFQRERRASEPTADRNGIEIRHGRITARVQSARKPQVTGAAGPCLRLLNSTGAGRPGS